MHRRTLRPSQKCTRARAARQRCASCPAACVPPQRPAPRERVIPHPAYRRGLCRFARSHAHSPLSAQSAGKRVCHRAPAAAHKAEHTRRRTLQMMKPPHARTGAENKALRLCQLHTGCPAHWALDCAERSALRSRRQPPPLLCPKSLWFRHQTFFLLQIWLLHDTKYAAICVSGVFELIAALNPEKRVGHGLPLAPRRRHLPVNPPWCRRLAWGGRAAWGRSSPTASARGERLASH